MKIIVEEYPYAYKDVAETLQSFEPKSQNGKVSIGHVGYFYDKKLADCVFFLPKVILDENGCLFGREGCTPEKFIDLSKALKDKTLEKTDYDFLSNFAVWIYRTVNEFYRTHPYSEILLHASFSRQDDSKHDIDKTLLDVLLSLIAFNNENQDYLKFTVKNAHSGLNKINWTRTVAKERPIEQKSKNFVYINPINRRKQINFDEELLIMFFSILQHINEKYGFCTPINFAYELITGKRFEELLNGSGLKRLRNIKYKYFSDKDLQLWRLCYSFFDKAQSMKSSTQGSDYMLAKDFHLVFEAMIDELLSDKDIPEKLKEQKDGKIIDHIFRYKSLLNTQNEEIYYIGDSKYYRIGNKLGDNSIYKQYTYARNVIQYNIDLFLNGNECLPYRDELTEGYNITPNFFISAEISRDREKRDYKNDYLTERNFERDKHLSRQFINRLFDRDTLLLSHYDINFLFVLSLYASGNKSEKETFRKKAKAVFREKIISIIKSEYEFHLLKASERYSLKSAVEINFRRLHGKAYSPDGKHLLLALDKSEQAVENKRLLEELMPYFYVYPYELGTDINEVVREFSSREKGYKNYVAEDNLYDRLAASPAAGYDSVKNVFIDSEKIREEYLKANKLGNGEVHKARPLGDETVLVGYFNGDEHLKQIIKSKLYYVRIGSRPGSLRFDIPPGGCRYLFLHNRKQYYLFKLKELGPRIFTGSELLDKGFKPGKPQDAYLGFDLEDGKSLEITDIEMKEAFIRGIGNRSADSYFTTLGELFGV